MFQRAGLAVRDLTQAGIPERDEEVSVERHDTFVENAIAKARYFQELAGCPVVADDSGLEVLALGGEPGVRSKRWSGRLDLTGLALDEANNARLRAALSGVSDRRARYVCAAAYADGTRVLTEVGATEGTIVEEARGRGGFGYDPYFYSAELGCTFGEATSEVKEAVSHRGRALRALLLRIAQLRAER
jgi:XTP/dITP diphosphohydrolase